MKLVELWEKTSTIKEYVAWGKSQTSYKQAASITHNYGIVQGNFTKLVY